MATTTSSPQTPPEDNNLLSVRAAVIIIIASTVAAIVAWMTAQTNPDPFTIVIRAGAVWAATAALAHQVLIRKS